MQWWKPSVASAPCWLNGRMRGRAAADQEGEHRVRPASYGISAPLWCSTPCGSCCIGWPGVAHTLKPVQYQTMHKNRSLAVSRVIQGARVHPDFLQCPRAVARGRVQHPRLGHRLIYMPRPVPTLGMTYGTWTAHLVYSELMPCMLFQAIQLSFFRTRPHPRYGTCLVPFLSTLGLALIKPNETNPLTVTC